MSENDELLRVAEKVVQRHQETYDVWLAMRILAPYIFAGAIGCTLLALLILCVGCVNPPVESSPDLKRKNALFYPEAKGITPTRAYRTDIYIDSEDRGEY